MQKSVLTALFEISVLCLSFLICTKILQMLFALAHEGERKFRHFQRVVYMSKGSKWNNYIRDLDLVSNTVKRLSSCSRP